MLNLTRRLSHLDGEGMLIMKLATVAAALTLASALWIAPAEARRGCLKGAVVGGVAGHYAGQSLALWARSAAAPSAITWLTKRRSSRRRWRPRRALNHPTERGGPQRAS